MAQASTDWIEWAGGEMPVDSAQAVTVRLRHGKSSVLWPLMHAPSLSWVHTGGDGDIIAYRVVSA
jgi:hypothetical protein